MYYEQLFQTNEAKMNFVKGLIRISKADGGISPEEQTFFIDAARGLGISEEDIAMLPAVMNQKEKISLAFASRSEVLCFLREALQLCMLMTSIQTQSGRKSWNWHKLFHRTGARPCS